jgi:hypothetical protein
VCTPHAQARHEAALIGQQGQQASARAPASQAAKAAGGLRGNMQSPRTRPRRVSVGEEGTGPGGRRRPSGEFP